MDCLGIDVGGSGIKGAIVDTVNGTLMTERLRFETPNPATPQAVAKKLSSWLTRLAGRGRSVADSRRSSATG